MKNDFLVRSANGEYRLQLNDVQSGKGQIDGNDFSLDIIETGSGLHVIRDKKGYEIEVISLDRLSKKVELRINGLFYSFEVRDKYDELLESMGFDSKRSGKIAEIKAPMPGLVIEVLVSAGELVKADQPLLILEAMKMENVIKSPADNSIKLIDISKGDSVEKNQRLLVFN